MTHCAQCDQTFAPKRRDQRFCSKNPCRNRYYRDSLKTACNRCERPMRARGLCSMHYKADVERANGREKDAWTDARRDSYHRRKALRKGASTGEPVRLSEIAKRDGYRCGLCTEPVDMNVKWPEPLSPSIDHVLPLAKGGAHDPGNVQLAHLYCNTAKGNRVAA